MKGKILGSRYKITEYLAEGGFGRTYLAEDTQIPGKDICVVKQLYPSSSNPQFLAIARRLFKTEASTLHSLGHHQQIPELLAYFEEEEKFYLVQQYIKGVTLGKELDSGEIWSEKQVAELLKDGLNILKFVHSKQVIHRDVKPDNLIRRESDGKVVLVDFGTVKKVLQGQQTNIGQLTVPVGTQGYMPTEQARGKPRPTSDIYALGMIGIQALTGIAPLEIPEDDEGELLWECSASVSQELSSILTRMTHYHFKDRYQSALDALQALEEILDIDVTTKVQSITATQAIDKNVTQGRSIGETAETSGLVNLPVIISTIDRLDAHSAIANNQHNTLETSGLSDISVDDEIENKLINIQSVVKPPVQPKKRNINIISLIIALVMVSVVGIGAYLVIQQSMSKLKINIPRHQPESQPNNSTERKKQGEGFRKDL